MDCVLFINWIAYLQCTGTMTFLYPRLSSGKLFSQVMKYGIWFEANCQYNYLTFQSDFMLCRAIDLSYYANTYLKQVK